VQRVGHAGNQVTMLCYDSLDELIEYAFPNALAIEGISHGEDAKTLIILDLNYKYTVWLACLSLDHRWTLSPRENARVLEIPDMP
jgi:hypothetical protein